MFMRFRIPLIVALLAAGLGTASAVASSAMGARLDQLPQSWRDEAGEPLALSALGGRRVILTMAYASCHKFCPMTMASLRGMQRALDARGESAEIVVVGYDPQNDKPDVWRQYRKSHHLDRDNWHFLSGSREDTERLARSLGFDFWVYDEHVMHASRVVIFNAAGAVQRELAADNGHWDAAL
jgi:protein SCO1/2